MSKNKNEKNIGKETQTQRKSRVKESGKSLSTKVVTDKTKYTRKKKHIDDSEEN
jgi:hypothetical protein